MIIVGFFIIAGVGIQRGAIFWLSFFSGELILRSIFVYLFWGLDVGEVKRTIANFRPAKASLLLIHGLLRGTQY